MSGTYDKAFILTFVFTNFINKFNKKQNKLFIK